MTVAKENSKQIYFKLKKIKGPCDVYKLLSSRENILELAN